MPPSPFVAAASPTTTRSTHWTETGPTHWLIDSGSSFHLVGRKDLPHNVGPERRQPITLHTAKGKLEVKEQVNLDLPALPEAQDSLALPDSLAVLSLGK